MALDAKNVALSYRDGADQREIFTDVNFTVEKGDALIILGPSGSGKSSLLYLLAGLRRPSRGTIAFAGVDVSTPSHNSRLRYDSFGFVFQQHFLIPYMTVQENIAISHERVRPEAITTMLDGLGLQGYEKKRPFQLSGGERQRVAIGRALAKMPEAVFADEPTASLDRVTAKTVYDLLRSHAQDSILVIATHDRALLHGDERMIFFEDGKVVERSC
jgi:putative ABC transport system ATP-binding protein